MDEKFLAYIAGFFDGEGYIGITHKRSGKYYVRLEITNTNLEILIEIKNIFSGWIKLKPKRSGWKQAYVLILESKKAVFFLESIFPFLKIKIAQAQLALELQSSRGSGRWKIPEEVKSKRERIYLKLKKLNQRGIERELIN